VGSTAKLLDFGLAKPATMVATAPGSGSASVFAGAPTQVSPAHPVTAAGTIVGTVQYMSPEQIEGHEADARSDIFALGLVLYEMITGKRAFQGKTQASIAAGILALEPPPMSSLQPLTPPSLERVVQTCLAKDPAERFQSAHDLKLQLEWLLESGAAPTPIKKAARARRENIAWGAVALLLLGLLAVGWESLRVRDELAAHTRPVKSSIIPAPDVVLSQVPVAVISPDGKRLVYGGFKGGTYMLWLQAL